MSEILNGLLPAPCRTETAPAGTLLLDAVAAIAVQAPAAEAAAFHLAERLTRFGRKLPVTATAGTQPAVIFRSAPELPPEAWTLRIDAAGIVITCADPAGARYAAGALGQLWALALAGEYEAASQARLPFGFIEDAPRFRWRGLMIDSARHFQSVAKLKDVIALMAEYRLNVFHWHLTDSQSWRLATPLSAGLCGGAWLDEGAYTPEDIADVLDWAARHQVTVVPEIDLPGHSGALLRGRPEFACAPERPGQEICLGNPAAKDFLIALLAEVAALFPASPYLHLGGDEADPSAWEACPRCRAARDAAGVSTMRELEAHFMAEMAQEVLKLGRKPIVWHTAAPHTSEVTAQVWYSVNDLTPVVQRGNPCIFSVHTNTYLDYPASAEESHAAWMPLLTEEGVYLTEPTAQHGDRLLPQLLGVEACLWTERVPEWRLLPKLLPRLAALAEVAWSRPEHKDFSAYLSRRRRLRAAGWSFF